MNYLIVDERAGKIELIGSENEGHDINSLFNFALSKELVTGKYIVVTPEEVDDLNRTSKYFNRRENIEDFFLVNESRQVSIFDEFREHSGKITSMREANILLFANRQVAGFHISTDGDETLSNFIVARHAVNMGFPEDTRYILLSASEARALSRNGEPDHESLAQFILNNIGRHVLLIPACLAEGVSELMERIREDSDFSEVTGLLLEALDLNDLDFLRGIIDDYHPD